MTTKKQIETKKSNAGRKEKYTEFVKPRLEEITYLCRLGEIEENICKLLGVGLSNFNRYKNEYKELRDALKKGKIASNAKVAASLFKRANGYSYKEITREPVTQLDINGDPVTDPLTGAIIKLLQITKEVTKDVVPDTTAQIFYLKNRDPLFWRDKQETNVTGGPGGSAPILINYIAPVVPPAQDELLPEVQINPSEELVSGEPDAYD